MEEATEKCSPSFRARCKLGLINVQMSETNLSALSPMEMQKYKREKLHVRDLHRFSSRAGDMGDCYLYAVGKNGLEKLTVSTVEVIHCNDEPDVSIRIQINKFKSNHLDWKNYNHINVVVYGDYLHCDEYDSDTGPSDAEPSETDPFPNRTKRHEELLEISEFIYPELWVENSINVVKKLCSFSRMRRSCYPEVDPHIAPDRHHFFIYMGLRIMIKFSNQIDKDFDKILSIANAAEDSLGTKMLAKGSFSDFILKSNKGREFPCHKAVLACQSDVFEAMFKSDMSEVENQCLVIDDMSDDAVEALWKYLYSRNIDQAIENIHTSFELLRAAEKYQIDHLKVICKEMILSAPVENMKPVTSFEMFHFCEKVQSLNCLQKKAASAFRRNSETFLDDTELVKAMLENPQIAKKMFSASMANTDDQYLRARAHSYYDLRTAKFVTLFKSENFRYSDNKNN